MIERLKNITINSLKDKDTRLLVAASTLFLIVQCAYSYILWNRSGNLPPTPGDSYNYIVNIHQIAESGNFFQDSRQLVYGSFNFLYALVATISGVSPTVVYEIFFYVGKVILLAVLLYFFRTFTQDKRLIAFLLTVLAFYVGNGEAHGFFWVVPSFWAVMLFLYLVALTKRSASIWVLSLIAIFYVFIHPLAVYTVAPIILLTAVLWLRKHPETKLFFRLTLVILVAAFCQQVYVETLNKKILGDSADFSRFSQVSSAVKEGVIGDIDPHGNSGLGERIHDGYAQIGLLSWEDVVDKIQGKNTADGYNNFVNIPLKIFRLFPSLVSLWNAYGFYLVIFPFLLPLLIGFFILIGISAWKRGSILPMLFISTLLTGIGATVHPQGYRFLVFVWPLTFLAIAEYLWVTIPQLSKWLQRLLLLIFTLFILGNLFYGISLVGRVARFHDYSWNSGCVRDLSNMPNDTVIFYSRYNLAINVFAGEGLYSLKAYESAEWDNYIKENNPKKIVYFLDNDASFYGNEKWLDDYHSTLKRFQELRQKPVIARSCGFFEVQEER